MDRRLRLVLEAESFEFHADSESFGRDVRRYTGFARLGWTVVRFTWKEVMFDPDYVRAVLTDLVALGPRACAAQAA
jgi:very-short-patch-repair endonuclease